MQLEQDIPTTVLIRVYLLGPLEIYERDPSGAWILIPKEGWKNSKPARTTLKRLLVQPGRRLSRDQLADDVWSESNAEPDVYSAISLVRGVIGKSLVKLWTASYEIARQALVWTDIDACGVLLKTVEDWEQPSITALPLLEQALTLFERGELLEDEYGIWCHPFRRRAEDMLRQVRLWLAETYEVQRKPWQAGEQYRAIILRDPSDEEALQRWLEMLVRHSRRREALKCYQDMKDFAEAQGFPLSNTLEPMIASLNKQPGRALMVSPQTVQYRKESNQTKDMDIIRRQFLEAGIHAVEAAPLLPLADLFESDILERFSQALLKPLHLDETTFHHLEICTRQFWSNRQSAVLSSRDLYHPVTTHLQRMIALLEGSLLPTERMRLCSLLSQTSQLLGEISLDMEHYGQGKAFHQAALVAAQEAENHLLEVIFWGRISLACIYSGSYSDALIAVQTARSLADKHATPMIQGWLAAIEAEIQAHLSQADLCLQILEQAEHFDDQPVTPLEGYLVRFDRSLLEGYRGACFRILSHPKYNQSPIFLQKAQDALREALLSLDPLFLQRKPTLLADLAVVTIHRQDIEEACLLINQAATLAAQMHLQKVTQRLIALREPLKPWKDLAPVKTLDAHLAFLSSQRDGQH